LPIDEVVRVYEASAFWNTESANPLRALLRASPTIPAAVLWTCISVMPVLITENDGNDCNVFGYDGNNDNHDDKALRLLVHTAEVQTWFEMIAKLLDCTWLESLSSPLSVMTTITTAAATMEEPPPVPKDACHQTLLRLLNHYHFSHSSLVSSSLLPNLVLLYLDQVGAMQGLLAAICL
jgi:hypothetical protein